MHVDMPGLGMESTCEMRNTIWNLGPLALHPRLDKVRSNGRRFVLEILDPGRRQKPPRLQQKATLPLLLQAWRLEVSSFARIQNHLEAIYYTNGACADELSFS